MVFESIDLSASTCLYPIVIPIKGIKTASGVTEITEKDILGFDLTDNCNSHRKDASQVLELTGITEKDIHH